MTGLAAAFIGSIFGTALRRTGIAPAILAFPVGAGASLWAAMEMVGRADGTVFVFAVGFGAAAATALALGALRK